MAIGPVGNHIQPQNLSASKRKEEQKDPLKELQEAREAKEAKEKEAAKGEAKQSDQPSAEYIKGNGTPGRYPGLYRLEADKNGTKKIAFESPKKTETDSKSAESDSKIVETGSKAAETDSKTAETSSKAAETDSKTAEADSKAAEADSKAAETDSKTAETDSKAAEAGSKTAEAESKTAEAGSKTAETDSKKEEPGSKAAKPEEDKANGNDDGKKGVICTADSSRVENEIKQLKDKERQLKQQLTSAGEDEGKRKEAEKTLAQAGAELKFKDTDAYIRANTVLTYKDA